MRIFPAIVALSFMILWSSAYAKDQKPVNTRREQQRHKRSPERPGSDERICDAARADQPKSRSKPGGRPCVGQGDPGRVLERYPGCSSLSDLPHWSNIAIASGVVPQSSGATVTHRPSSSSVTLIWQDRRLVGSRQSEKARTVSSSGWIVGSRLDPILGDVDVACAAARAAAANAEDLVQAAALEAVFQRARRSLPRPGVSRLRAWWPRRSAYQFSASTIVTLAMPPPSHIVCRP